MSVGADDNFVILMDQLRTIQRLMYKEIVFNKYQKKELAELSQKFEELYTQTQYQQKLLLFVSSLTIRGAEMVLPVRYINSLFEIERKDGKILPAPYELYPFLDFAQYLYRHPKELCLILLKTLELHPEESRVLIYSTIPSLFGDLFTLQWAEIFRSFSKCMFETAPGVASRFISFIFMVPAMFQFIKSVLMECYMPMSKVEVFCEMFLQSWKENSSLFPKFIIDIISDSNSPADSLFDNFVKIWMYAIMTHNILGEVMGISSEIVEQVLAVLEKSKEQLWTDLIQEPIHTNIFSDIGMTSYLNVPVKLMFSTEDLILLRTIASVAKSLSLWEGHLPKVAANDAYVSYAFSEPKDCHPLSTLGPSNDIDLEFRQILTALPIIPNISETHDYRNMFELLSQQVNLAPDEIRFSLEIKISRLYSEIGETLSFKDIIELLDSKLAERRQKHQQKLASIAQYQYKANYLTSYLKVVKKAINRNLALYRFKMIMDWEDSAHILSAEPDLAIYTDPDAFSSYFENIIFEWEAWLNSSKFTHWEDQKLMHSIVMRSISMESYRSYNPELSEQDDKLYNLFKDNRVGIIAEINDSFIQNFLDWPELLEEALELVKLFEASRLPILAGKALQRLFKELNIVTEAEVKSDAGENEYTPLRLLVFILANPPHLITHLSYVAHFMMVLCDSPECADVYTLSSALVGHFQAFLENSCPLVTKEN